MGESPHIVQAVSQLNQDNPDIFRHREDHLAHVFGLVLKAIPKGKLIQFRDTIHQHQNCRAEVFFQLFPGDWSVFQNVMQQSRRYCLHIQLQIGQNECHLVGMFKIGGSRFAGLSFMGALRKVVGFLNQLHISSWIVAENAVKKVLYVQSGSPFPSFTLHSSPMRRYRNP